MSTNRDTVTLPILPWSAVLFPGAHQTLSIVNPHQRTMIADVTQRDTGFVVCLSRSPAPTANTEWSEPVSAGTVARVLDITDNTSFLNVQAVGISRVSLLSFRLVQDTLIGQFRFMPDSDETVPNPLIDEAHALGSEVWSVVRADDSRPILPRTPETLSYWIAAHVPMPVATQEELLEVRSTRSRLAKEISLLRGLMDGLRTEHSG